MKPSLYIDTNFGLGDFDYVNCKSYELSRRLFYEEKIHRDIDINFSKRIKISLYEFSYKKQKFGNLSNS